MHARQAKAGNIYTAVIMVGVVTKMTKAIR